MIKAGQKYRHYKDQTHLYKVIALAKHSETMEDMVVYQTLYDNPVSEFWARPASMWFESVQYGGQVVQRFTLVEE